MKLDDVDERIIALLGKDSRTPNVALAKELGLTEGAVRWRIKRLVRQGIIRRFTIDVAVPAAAFAVLMLKAEGDTKKMMSAVSSLGIHRDAYEISGEYDGCMILYGSTVKEIDRKIDRIRKVKGVADTRTFLSFGRY
jgi:DNA-binding Lrp family transcriptional regulator